MLTVRLWQDLPSFSVRTLVASTATLLLVVTGACDGLFSSGGEGTPEFSVEVAYEAIESGTVEVEQIDRGQYGDIVEGTRKVLPDQEAYATFWQRLHADRDSTPPRPEVDFDRRVVVALVLGERPSGGYSVDVDDVLADERGEEVRVQFTERVPGENCAVTGALTSPYVLVTVDAQGGSFSFARSEETRSC